MQEGKKKQVAAHFIDLTVYVDECVCVPVLMCVGALGGQQECLTPEASYSREPKGVGAGTRPWVFWKSSKCS